MLWLCNALQLFQEAVFCIDTNQIHVKLSTENTFYPVSFVLPKQTVIHKDTSQPITNGFVQQHGSNCTVHAAAEGAQDFLSRQIMRVSFNAPVNKVFHIPIAVTIADVKQEITKDLIAVGCMRYFRVELYPIEIAAFVAHGSAGTLVCTGDGLETNGRTGYKIGMTHPAK